MSRNRGKQTSRMVHSAKVDDCEGIQLLLNQGVSIDFQDANGFTALIMAASAGKSETVSFLLGKGADPNIQDRTGCTALIRASRAGYKGIAKLLLAGGADIGIRDSHNKTALDRAKDWRQTRVVALLETWISNSVVLPKELPTTIKLATDLGPQPSTTPSGVDFAIGETAQSEAVPIMIPEQRIELRMRFRVEELAEMAYLAEQVGGSQHAEAIRDIAVFLSDQRFRVVVFGEFSVGKSTLINALFGRYAFPAKAMPTTGLVTLIRFGEPEGVRVEFTTGRTEFCPLEQLGSFVTLDMESRARDGIEAIDVALQSPFLRDGLTLIDTPGVNDSEVQTRRALRSVMCSDLVLLVLRANQLLGAEMRQTACEWMVNELGKPVVPVLNGLNLIPDEEQSDLCRILDAWAKTALTPVLENKSYFRVNAIGALRYALDVNGAERPADDFFVLKKVLKGITGSKRQKLQMSSRANATRTVLRRVADWNRRELDLLSKEADALLHRREERKGRLIHVADKLKARVHTEDLHIRTIVRDELRKGMESVITHIAEAKRNELEQNSLQSFSCFLEHAVREVEDKARERLDSLAAQANVLESQPLTLSELVHVHECAAIQAAALGNNAAVGRGRVIGGGLAGAAFGTVFLPLIGTVVGGVLGGLVVRWFGRRTRKKPNHVAIYVKAACRDWEKVTPIVEQLTAEQFSARYNGLVRDVSLQLADLERTPPVSAELLKRRKLQERLDSLLDQIGRERQPHDRL